jgi:hypothetical protein
VIGFQQSAPSVPNVATNVTLIGGQLFTNNVNSYAPAATFGLTGAPTLPARTQDVYPLLTFTQVP